MAGKGKTPAWAAKARAVGGSGRIPLTGPVLPPEADTEDGQVTPAQLKALNDRLAAMEAENKALKRRQRGAMFAKPAPQQAPAAQTAVPLHNQRVEIDPASLPDPYVDPKGYAAAVAKGVQAGLDAKEAVDQAKKQAAEAEAAARQRVAAGVEVVWKRFRKEYPEFEGLDNFVEAVASEIVQEGVALGSTAQDIVFGHTQEFMEEVADRMRDRAEELGIDLAGDPGAEEETAEATPEQTAAALLGFTTPDAGAEAGSNGNVVDTSRTATIEGGTKGGVRPAPAQKGGETTFLDEFKDLRKGMGYF